MRNAILTVKNDCAILTVKVQGVVAFWVRAKFYKSYGFRTQAMDAKPASRGRVWGAQRRALNVLVRTHLTQNF